MKIDRRHILKMAGGTAAAITLVPINGYGDVPAMDKAIKDMFGSAPIREGRIKLSIPTLSENGYSVDLKVEAESPMSDDDFVRQIAVFSERNPIPLIASYHFTPLSGRAELSSKIRLGGTQIVHAIAEMSDGSLWKTSTKVYVTLAACVTG